MLEVNISPSLMLTIGLVALALFVVVLAGAFWVTMRNRRVIQRRADELSNNHSATDVIKSEDN